MPPKRLREEDCGSDEEEEQNEVKKTASKAPKGGTKAKSKPRRASYDEGALQKALLAVAEGMGVRAAAKEYKVPSSTLCFRKSEQFKKKGYGPPPVLTENEENQLINWIGECVRKGFPRRSLDLAGSVQTFLNENPRPNPFKNNKPGKSWDAGFLRRHPEIKERTSEAVTSASASVSRADIIKWFTSVEELLKEEDVSDVLKDPSRIFDGDETCFLLWPKAGKCFVRKGTRNVYKVDGGQAKSTITVMFTFSANGAVVPPMIVYPYVRLPRDIAFSVPDGWGIGTSETGSMNSAVFYEYIANTFNAFLTENNIKRPVVLFVDGHKSHLTYHLSTLCEELKIILVCSHPNVTRILQPPDVTAFKPLKDGWEKTLLEWRQEHINEVITKKQFAPLLKKTVDTYMKKTTLVNGFRASGIYPWDYNNIDFSKSLGASSSRKECTEEPSPFLLYDLGEPLWATIIDRQESDGDADDEN